MHMWRMTFDSVLTLFARGRIEPWVLLTTYFSIWSRIRSNFPPDPLVRVFESDRFPSRTSNLLHLKLSGSDAGTCILKKISSQFWHRWDIIWQWELLNNITSSNNIMENPIIFFKNLTWGMRKLALRDSKDSTTSWKLVFMSLNVHDKKAI